MNRLQRVMDDARDEEINRCMTLLKSYESLNPNDITGLLSGMASFLHAYSTSKPIHELSKQIWTLKRQLQLFPYDVNEHSKAIEALTILFVHSMESLVAKEDREDRREKRRTVRKGKEWEFVPSQSRQLLLHHSQASSRPHDLPSEYEGEPSIRLSSQSQYQPSGYGESWEESAMDMDDFDLNQPHSTIGGGEDRGWEEGGPEMPLLEEEDGEEGRYSGGLRGRGGGMRRRDETIKCDKREERRYEGGLRGGRTVSTPPSKTLIITNSSELKRFVPVSQRRIVVNKDKPIKVSIIRKGMPSSPSKINLMKMGTTPKREGCTIGMGKPNISHENNIIAKICPRSAIMHKYGVDNQGSSFISRSRARISGATQDREENEEGEDSMDDKKRTSLEETVVESRKKEVKKELHDGRLTGNPTEATFNTNLSETWWALEARKDGASLLSNRLKRTIEEKKDEKEVSQRKSKSEADD